MKVGILTFHKAINLGAALQAAALQQYIHENIGCCEIVDFLPNNVVRPKDGAVKALARKCKNGLTIMSSWIRKDQAARFRRFYKENYRISDQTYYGDAELRQKLPVYDVVISGSDQILNTTLSGCSESFYLTPWTEETCKISYASSLGRTEISQDEYRLIRQELPKFRAVSARENSAAEIISAETGIHVPVVVDPVFLLSKEQWEKKCRPISEKGSFVLVYAMEFSAVMEELIRRQQAAGKRVLLLCGGKSAKKLPGEKLSDVGPGEFLSYIKQAELVITNSFHGSALSVIFGKSFYCASHATRNARLESLLQNAGQPESLLPVAECPVEALPVDSDLAMENLLPMIAASKTYLTEAILAK